MSWLKKVGLDVLKYLPVLLGISQLVSQQNPNNAMLKTVVGDLNAIPGMIVTGEALIKGEAGAKTGPQKLAALTPAVQQLIKEYVTANLPGSPKLKDPLALENAAAQITGGFANALNAFE